MANIDEYEQFEIDRTRDYNPDTGISTRIVYAATEAKIDEIQNYWANAAEYDDTPLGYGYKSSKKKTASGCFLNVLVPDEILYTTRWHLETELSQISVYWLPATRTNLGFTGDLTTFIGLREWMQEVAKIQRIVNEVRHANSLLSQATFDTLNESVPKADLVYSIIRDGEYQEWKRPVLKRVRVMPVGLFGTRTKLVGPPQLYSLDGIYNLFGLDDNVYDQANTVYNDLPTADPNTMWAWKLRRDDSEQTIGSGKVTECRDWVFGRWSTVRNTFIE